MTLKWLQENLPWQGKYTDSFESGPTHNHFYHNVLHLMKAVGKLAAAVEPKDHYESHAFPNVSDQLADLVICAVRLANVNPNGIIDLKNAIINRLHQKNKLPADFGIDADVSEVDRASVRAQPREWFEKNHVK